MNLGERSYEIVFDELEKVATHVLRVTGDCSSIFLVSNSVVGPLYAKVVIEAFRKHSLNIEYIEIKDGESEKTPETYLKLISSLLEKQIQRSSVVLALGGGVTTDIVGFAASTVLRGVKFITIPTTLLAMVDASVGGKTGVNTKFGKNLLGSFWQPTLVFASLNCLSTLEDAEFRCGLGEIIKHAVLDNEISMKIENESKTVSHLDWLLEYGKIISSRTKESLKYLKIAVKRSCELKSKIVALDERESGSRALLNFGHTVAHAIEYVQGIHAKSQNKLRHGEAVAVGCLAETQLAQYRGTLQDNELIDKLKSCLKACNLPTGVRDLDVQELIKATFMDKKRVKDYIKLTQPVKEGNVILEKVKPAELEYAFRQVGQN